ncbi:Cathepsin L-like [Dirofilaria immitis]
MFRKHKQKFMPSIIILLNIFVFLVDSVVTLNNEIEQLRVVLKALDQDYKQGNTSKLTSDFKSALNKYGDGENSQKLTAVQSFLKKLETDGEEQAMEKLEVKWNDFRMSLGKHYNPNENSLRMAIFESNELATEAINKKYDQGIIPYKVAMNEMADMTDEEVNMMNGLHINETSLQAKRRARNLSARYFKYDPKESIPDSFDWRTKGYVTPVKYQGVCGTQNAVDCTIKFGNSGCDGGFMNRIFKYTTKNGIAANVNYPYVESVQRCQDNQKRPVAYNKDFMKIEPGVYSKSNCGPLNHVVLLVGYGTDPKYGDYWIVKNSWGPDWGLKGYVHMARNKNNMCHIASLASFPI